jgi:arsenite methyltransferase
MNCSLYEQPLFRQAAGPEFRPGGLALTDELASECGLEPGAVVLDLACGVGSTASQLARSWGVTMVGLDCSPGFIEEARARDPEVSWTVGQADALPYPDGHFDAVFCECFLSTVDEPAKVLREVRRVLRPGGRLAMSDMYLRQPGAAPSSREIPAATCLRGAAGKEATLALLERTGFAVRTWRDRSDTLKTLIASLIFAYGSAAAFWAAACGADEGGAHEGDAGRLAAAKPGYYLLVAQSPPDVATESRGDR